MTQQDIDPKQALVVLWNLSQGNGGESEVAAQLLLGLYNASRFPFQLTQLRRLDCANLAAALAVLRLDATPQREVHEWLNLLLHRTDMSNRFEHMAHRWGLKGKCKKAWLAPLQPWNV